jgi:hypothetical protein
VSHVPLPVGSACSDGNPCNGNEVCDGAGTCLPGTPPALDDANPCTSDSCDALAGVVHAPMPSGSPCAPQANLCKEGGVCDGAGTCRLTVPPIAVDDGNPCTKDACDPATGVCRAARDRLLG